MLAWRSSGLCFGNRRTGVGSWLGEFNEREAEKSVGSVLASRVVGDCAEFFGVVVGWAGQKLLAGTTGRRAGLGGGWLVGWSVGLRGWRKRRKR